MNVWGHWDIVIVFKLCNNERATDALELRLQNIIQREFNVRNRVNG
jgi:hypothetical protein